MAARALQGGKDSLDGAMVETSDSELGDPVDPPNMEGVEDGELPPRPEHGDEHMEISAEESNQPEQEGWQQELGLDEKGHDPSQSWLGWSEGEEFESATDTRRLSRQEKEAQKKKNMHGTSHPLLCLSATDQIRMMTRLAGIRAKIV